MRLRVAAAVGLGALAWAGAAGADQPRTQLQRQLDSIVRTWSKRLNAGDNAGVARLFALPARIVQPPFAYRFTRRGDIAAWHASLPCAGRVVRISFRANTATATFKLANRGAIPCDGPGALVAARFTVVRGLITLWEQVPVPKAGATA